MIHDCVLPDDWSATSAVGEVVALAMPVGWSDRAIIPLANEA